MKNKELLARAVANFTSGDADEELLISYYEQMLETNPFDNPHVLMWEPFENYSVSEILENIDNLYDDFVAVDAAAYKKGYNDTIIH